MIGYARLSTAEQAHGLALEQQVERLRAAGCDEVLVDLQSGASVQRPRYQQLLRLVEQRRVAAVVATRLDRLTRGASETVRLSEVFSAPGAPELRLLDDPVDLSSVGGRLQLRVLGVVAAAEVERLRERSAHGKNHRKALGMVDAAPLGLRVAAGRLEPDAAPWLCTVADRRQWSRAEAVLELVGVVETATQYAGWAWFWQTFGIDLSRAGVTRLVLNPALRGARVGKRQKSGSQHVWLQVEENAFAPPLVEPDRHRALEARLRGERARNCSRDTRRAHALTGLVVCQHCGRRMQRRNMPRRNAGPGPLPGSYRCLNPACGFLVPGERRNGVTELAAMQAALDALALAAPRIADALELRALPAPSTAELDALQQRRQQLLQLAAEGAAGLEPALAAVDRQIEAAAAVVPVADGALLWLRQQAQSLVSELLARGWQNGAAVEAALEVALPGVVESDPLVAAILLHVAGGAAAWLDPRHAETTWRWADQWIRQIVVADRAVVEVELNV